MRRALAIAVIGAALAGAAPASAADCVTYPGDAAPKNVLAAWMAYGAAVRGVPGELPVMAALAESGLSNIAADDGDSVGFFQMRLSTWNSGPYAGCQQNPQLQLNCFVDTALSVVTSKRLTDPGYGATEDRWGEWIADVERPAQIYRGCYQPRLGEARVLIGAGCLPDGTPAPPPEPPADTTAPGLDLARARPLSRLKGLSIAAECGSEECTVEASARIAMSGAARVYRLSSSRRTLAAGDRAQLTLRFGHRLRAALIRRRARSRHAAAQITVRAADAAGNRSSERRRVRLF